MEKISIFFTSKSIETIKRFGSFAQVVNVLVTLLSEDIDIQNRVKDKIRQL